MACSPDGWKRQSQYNAICALGQILPLIDQPLRSSSAGEGPCPWRHARADRLQGDVCRRRRFPSPALEWFRSNTARGRGRGLLRRQLAMSCSSYRLWGWAVRPVPPRPPPSARRALPNHWSARVQMRRDLEQVLGGTLVAHNAQQAAADHLAVAGEEGVKRGFGSQQGDGPEGRRGYSPPPHPSMNLRQSRLFSRCWPKRYMILGRGS